MSHLLLAPGEHARRGPTVRRGLAGLAVAALAAMLLAGAGLAAPSRVAAGIGPLPACRYDDITTAPRAYTDWPYTLVDTILRVPRSYVPPDLVPASRAGLPSTLQVRAVMVDDLAALAAAAQADESPIGIQSAYRSYAMQEATFQYWVDKTTYREALLVSARPGHSEHQLGLAIDFKSAVGGVPWNGGDWAKTPAGTWMLQHAWEYGFVLSYPKADLAKVCYSYEPWHYRYLGRDLAAKVHASGLTIREYLWTHFTTVDASPRASQDPGTSGAPGSESPTLEPSPDASPSASPTNAPPTPATSPSAGVTAAPTGDPGPPPSPAATWFGLDPALAIGAIVVVVLVVGGSLALRRRGA